MYGQRIGTAGRGGVSPRAEQQKRRWNARIPLDAVELKTQPWMQGELAEADVKHTMVVVRAPPSSVELQHNRPVESQWKELGIGREKHGRRGESEINQTW